MKHDQLLRYLQSDDFQSEKRIISLKRFRPIGEDSIMVDYYVESENGYPTLCQSSIKATYYYEHVKSVRQQRIKQLLG